MELSLNEVTPELEPASCALVILQASPPIWELSGSPLISYQVGLGGHPPPIDVIVVSPFFHTSFHLVSGTKEDYQSNGTKEEFHSSRLSAANAQEQRMNETWWSFLNFSRKSNFQWNRRWESRISQRVRGERETEPVWRWLDYTHRQVAPY